MDERRQKIDLDSSSIRINLLKRSLTPTQPAKATEEERIDVDGKSIRIDAGRREILRHPFQDGTA